MVPSFSKETKAVSSVTAWALVMGGLISVAIGPSRGSAGEIQKILDNSKAFAAMPRMKHTPAFRLEPFEPVQARPEAKGSTGGTSATATSGSA